MTGQERRAFNQEIPSAQFAKAVETGISNEFIEAAKNFGIAISRKGQGKDKEVSSSQIRNIFGTIKKLEMKSSMSRDFDLPQLRLLQARIAYAKRRADTRKFDALAKEISDALWKVLKAPQNEQQESFRRFCQGFEAILAYHRAYEDKKED